MVELCISIDVEEDIPGVLPPGEHGVEEGLPALLRLLGEEHIRADFFFLSSIVRKHPDAVAAAVRKGHHVGNHGWDHRFLCTKSTGRQRDEIRRSTDLLSSVCPSPPSMFRAPNFSADATTLGLLDHAGYTLDSSVLPGRYVRRFGVLTVYDHRQAPSQPFRPAGVHPGGSLVEIPVTENPLQPGTPLGQGALNLFGPKTLIDLLLRTRPSVAVFLIHPWELVDLDSRYRGLSPEYRRICSSDMGPLRTFLTEARRYFRFSTLPEVAARAEWGTR